MSGTGPGFDPQFDQFLFCCCFYSIKREKSVVFPTISWSTARVGLFLANCGPILSWKNLKTLMILRWMDLTLPSVCKLVNFIASDEMKVISINCHRGHRTGCIRASSTLVSNLVLCTAGEAGESGFFRVSERYLGRNHLDSWPWTSAWSANARFLRYNTLSYGYVLRTTMDVRAIWSIGLLSTERITNACPRYYPKMKRNIN